MYTILMFLVGIVSGRSSKVYDGDGIADGIDKATGSGKTISDVTTLLNNILNLVGLIAVVAVIIAGIYLVVGGQEEANREKAKKIILYTVIGLVVIVLASAIVNFIASIF